MCTCSEGLQLAGGVQWSVSMTRSWIDKECTMGGVYKVVREYTCVQWVCREGV